MVVIHPSLPSLVRHSSRYIFNIKPTSQKKVEETVKMQYSESGDTHANDLHLKHFSNHCCLSQDVSKQRTPSTRFLGTWDWKHYCWWLLGLICIVTSPRRLISIITEFNATHLPFISIISHRQIQPL